MFTRQKHSSLLCQKVKEDKEFNAIGTRRIKKFEIFSEKKVFGAKKVLKPFYPTLYLFPIYNLLLATCFEQEKD
jgi:hypothetical protein